MLPPIAPSWQTVVGSLQRVSVGFPVNGQQGSPAPPQPAHLPAWHIPKGWLFTAHICPAATQLFWMQQPPSEHLLSPGQQGSPGPPHWRQESPAHRRPSPHLPGAGRQQGSPAPPQWPQVVPVQRRSGP
jgi:hypothetical protein